MSAYFSQTRSMKNKHIAVVSLIAATVGALAMYLYVFVFYSKSSIPEGWIEVSISGHGYSYSSEALFDSDISLPDLSALHGKIKFLRYGADGGNHSQLGYLIRVSVKSLDTAKIPETYRQRRSVERHKGGEVILEPVQQVVYKVHFEFELKDKDGFVLMSTTSEPSYLYSGQENVFQGIAQQKISLEKAKHTKSVTLNMSVEKCETCRDEWPPA